MNRIALPVEWPHIGWPGSSQYASLGVEPLWDSLPNFCFSKDGCGFVFHEASSLSRERVCLVTGHSPCLVPRQRQRSPPPHPRHHNPDPIQWERRTLRWSMRLECMDVIRGLHCNNAFDTFPSSRISTLKMEATRPPKRWFPTTKLHGAKNQKSKTYRIYELNLCVLYVPSQCDA
jgi:hypothetical protein